MSGETVRFHTITFTVAEVEVLSEYAPIGWSMGGDVDDQGFLTSAVEKLDAALGAPQKEAGTDGG